MVTEDVIWAMCSSKVDYCLEWSHQPDKRHFATVWWEDIYRDETSWGDQRYKDKLRFCKCEVGGNHRCICRNEKSVWGYGEEIQQCVCGNYLYPGQKYTTEGNRLSTQPSGTPASRSTVEKESAKETEREEHVGGGWIRWIRKVYFQNPYLWNK